MPATLSTEDKIEIVLIVGDNYKTYREAAAIFNNRHPEKNLHYGTVSKILKKFKSFGDVSNKFTNKRQRRVVNDDMEFEIMLSTIEHPKKFLRTRAASMSYPINKDTVSKILKKNRFQEFRYR